MKRELQLQIAPIVVAVFLVVILAVCSRLKIRTYPNGKPMDSMAVDSWGTRYITFNCPKCGKVWNIDSCHRTPFRDGSWICDLHETCWSNSSVLVRVKMHLMFMGPAQWPEADQLLVLQATLEGK